MHPAAAAAQGSHTDTATVCPVQWCNTLWRWHSQNALLCPRTMPGLFKLSSREKGRKEAGLCFPLRQPGQDDAPWLSSAATAMKMHALAMAATLDLHAESMQPAQAGADHGAPCHHTSAHECPQGPLVWCHSMVAGCALCPSVSSMTFFCCCLVL